MSYDDRMWNYCYNTAYLILNKDNADLMLNTLKDVGGPHGFVCDTKEDFEAMMEDAMKANDKVSEIVKAYIAGVEEHNKLHSAKMKRKYGRKGEKEMTEEKTMENPDEMSMAKIIGMMIEEVKFKFKIDPSFRITNKSIKEIRVGAAKYRHDSINSGVHVTRAMVKSFFIILNSDVINDVKLEGNIKKKIKTLDALFGHKELRVVKLFNKDYHVELSLPFKYRNDIYANKYMHTGVDKDGNIYIYVGKDFDDDPICNGYRKYMKSDKSEKLCYEKLTKKDAKKSFKKAEAQKDNVVLTNKPEPDVFVFNDAEKKLDRYKKLAAESGVPLIVAVQEHNLGKNSND